jgi:hypothetical protein
MESETNLESGEAIRCQLRQNIKAMMQLTVAKKLKRWSLYPSSLNHFIASGAQLCHVPVHFRVMKHEHEHGHGHGRA